MLIPTRLHRSTSATLHARLRASAKPVPTRNARPLTKWRRAWWQRLWCHGCARGTEAASKGPSGWGRAKPASRFSTNFISPPLRLSVQPLEQRHSLLRAIQAAPCAGVELAVFPKRWADVVHHPRHKTVLHRNVLGVTHSRALAPQRCHQESTRAAVSAASLPRIAGCLSDPRFRRSMLDSA